MEWIKQGVGVTNYDYFVNSYAKIKKIQKIKMHVI